MSRIHFLSIKKKLLQTCPRKLREKIELTGHDIINEISHLFKNSIGIDELNQRVQILFTIVQL